MHPVCSGPIGEPWSGSRLQALLYLMLVQVSLHPLVVYHILNLLIQTALHVVCGEAWCALVNYSGLPESYSLPWFNSVHWEVWLSLNNHVLCVFSAIPYLVFTPKCLLSDETEVSGLKPGGSHFLIILLLLAGRFFTLMLIGQLLAPPWLGAELGQEFVIRVLLRLRRG